MTVVDPIPPAAFRRAAPDADSDRVAAQPRAELASPYDVAEELVGDLSATHDITASPEEGAAATGRIATHRLSRVRAWMGGCPESRRS